MAENEIQEKKQRRPRKERDDVKMDRIADEFTDRVVHVNRVSKTVKGGKRFAFAALVVVGDQKVVSVLLTQKRKKFLMQSKKQQN